MRQANDASGGAPGLAVEAAAGSAPRALLVFVLGDTRYALPCERVAGIVAAVSIQRLPAAPAIVEGAINVRGAIVPVLDVASRFGASARTLHPDHHFILARTGDRTVALHVDRVAEVVSVPARTIRPAGSVPGVEYVDGIAAVDDGLLVIHDLDSFLALDEQAALGSALARAAASAPEPDP